MLSLTWGHAASDESARIGIRRPLPWSGLVVSTDRASTVWVPKTLSKSCEQAIFVDLATDARVSSDAVLLKIDGFGQRF
jgi:hypothetical protein